MSQKTQPRKVAPQVRPNLRFTTELCRFLRFIKFATWYNFESKIALEHKLILFTRGLIMLYTTELM